MTQQLGAAWSVAQRPGAAWSLAQQLLSLVCLFVHLGPGSSVPANSSAPLVVDGAVGENQTFPLDLTTANICSIFWDYNQEPVGVIKTGIDGRLQVIVAFSLWKGRLSITGSTSLQLGPLTAADAGSYRATIDFGNVSTPVTYTLRVFRRLRTLSVVHHVQHSKNGTCELQLACVLPGDAGDSVRFWWSAAGAVVGTEANLTVFRVPTEPGGSELTCTAENPISNVSSSISTSALCEVPDSRAAPVALWAMTVCMLIVVALLLAALVHCLQKRRLKGIFFVSTQQVPRPVQTLRSMEHEYTTSGTTVYAQITRPRQETADTVAMRDTESSTIYSTVQPQGKSCPGWASVDSEQRESGRHQPSGSQE